MSEATQEVELPEELKIVSFNLEYSINNEKVNKQYFLPQIDQLLKEMFEVLFKAPNLTNLSVKSEVEGAAVQFNFFIDENDTMRSDGAFTIDKDNPIAYLQGFFNYVNSVLGSFSEAQKEMNIELNYDHELGSGTSKKIIN